MTRYVAALAALCLFSAGAIAQEVVTDTTVTVPYGAWLDEARDVIISGVMLAIAWGFRNLPARVVDMFKMVQAEQLLKRAVEYAINTTADAAKGKALKVEIANEVVRKIAQYAIDRGPSWLIKWLGGQAGIEQMAIARIEVEPKAEVIAPPNAAAGVSPVLTKAAP